MFKLINLSLNFFSRNDQKASIGGFSEANDKLALSFNRDASKNFWITFDADNNRNIGRFSQGYFQSMSFFLLKPVVFSTYAITFHGADAIAYNGHLGDWIILENKVETGFPGPSVRKSLTTLQETYPPFRNFTLKDNESKVLTISKVGAFSASLSSEFTLKLQPRAASFSEDYVALGFLLHVNSRYLMFSCIVPNGSSSQTPAYFLGGPEILDVHGIDQLKIFSAARLADWLNLPDAERMAGLSERVSIDGKIT